MSRLLIISGRESVLSGLLRQSFEACDRITVSQVPETDLTGYDAIALLGGTEAEAKNLLLPARQKIDAYIVGGKPVFAEYVRGVGQVSFLDAQSTRFARPVLLTPCSVTGSLEEGTILDEQSNTRLQVYKTTGKVRPILQYVTKPAGFYRMKHVDALPAKTADYALWQETENLLICTFRLCDFAKAQFGPRKAWAEVISGIVRFLGGCIGPDAVLATYEQVFRPEQSVRDAALRAMNWFEQADMLVPAGEDMLCVKEGLAPDVYPDGRHRIAETIRNDCAGETAFAYFLKWKLLGQARDKEISDSLYRMPLRMQITEACAHQGMVRGSIDAWWGVSYQDDTARGFLLPLMWRMLLTGDRTDLPQVRLALDYLLKTTGTDGLRAVRVDFDDQYDETVTVTGLHAEKRENSPYAKWEWGGGVSGTMNMHRLREIPAEVPSAHYNAFYLSTLLLGYKLTGDERYRDAGVHGLTTLMGYYPFTAREHSETQEMCRLMMPLAVLTWVTGSEEHRGWLYRVAQDLQKVRHANGGYLEWDTGYTATCAGATDGEASVLAENGDPVMDMLYSLNWLPMAFSIAHYVTGDPWFRELWQAIAAFFAKIQIASADPLLDGVWPRAYDAAQGEVYGVPNDPGWAPWSVETGWTMSVIASGLMFGLMEEEIRPLFQ